MGANNIAVSRGKNGGIVLKSGESANGNFVRLKFIEATNLSQVVGNISGTLTGFSIGAGIEIDGCFTSIAVSTGRCVCYS
tara:strand:- start:10594 stop:10833 length:240 start_codon:yes stop_codon:yes gene_type:complete